MCNYFYNLTNIAKQFLIITVLIGCQGVFAHGDKASQEQIQKTVNEFLVNIVTDNLKHVNSFDVKKSEKYAHQQTPRVTLLFCSDSRVDAKVIDESPINNHFVVRNIGNQIETAEGSIEYGVNHLHTPVLLIVGHSGCGAIVAGRGDFSKESSHIQSELKTLDVKSTKTLEEGILYNVHHQVQVAQEKFKELVEKGELTIIGAVYDFRNDFKRDHGRLILIDINGEVDVEKLKGHPVIKNVKNVTVGVGE